MREYVSQRREKPDADVIFEQTGGYQFLSDQAEALSSLGIDTAWVDEAIDTLPEGQSKIALRLLELLVTKLDLVNAKETHIGRRGKAISCGFVDYLICLCLDHIASAKQDIVSRDLIFLIESRLAPDWKLDARSHHRDKYKSVVDAAIDCRAANQSVSLRSIADKLGVDHQTVRRWIRETGANEVIEFISKSDIAPTKGP